MNKDIIEGAFLEEAGKIRKNTTNKIQGAKDEARGKMQKNYGKLKESITE